MAETNLIFTLGLIIFIGILAGRIAEIYKFPKSIPLIIAGVIISLIGQVNIELLSIEEIRYMAVLIAEMALIGVLFKEGMHLDIYTLKKHILFISLIAFFGTILSMFLIGSFLSLILKYAIGLALLIGAIFAPTDPASTFMIIRGTGMQVKKKYEAILGGESALNDVVSIILVTVILIPLATVSQVDKEVNLDSNLSILLQGMWQFFGGIALGFIIGMMTLGLFKILSTTTEDSYLSFAAITLIFAIGFIINVSPAIAALTAGLLLGNPKMLKNPNYDKTSIFKFWDNITFLFELLSFIFVGSLFSIKSMKINILQLALLLSILIFAGRFVGVFVTTSFLELLEKYKNKLNYKDRFFISFAGMKGLTTAVLASWGYLAFIDTDPDIGNLILYSSILVMIITGLIQGIFMKKVIIMTKVNIDEEKEKEKLVANMIIKDTQLYSLVKDLRRDSELFHDINELDIPVKQGDKIINYLNIKKDEVSRKDKLMEAMIKMNREAFKALLRSYRDGKISPDIYFSLISNIYDDMIELRDIYQKYIDTSEGKDDIIKNERMTELATLIDDILSEINPLNEIIKVNAEDNYN